MVKFFKQYHWHWLLIRGIVALPFLVVHTLGEWALIAGNVVLDTLPNPRKED